jgi:hypothetical protein
MLEATAQSGVTVQRQSPSNQFGGDEQHRVTSTKAFRWPRPASMDLPTLLGHPTQHQLLAGLPSERQHISSWMDWRPLLGLTLSKVCQWLELADMGCAQLGVPDCAGHAQFPPTLLSNSVTQPGRANHTPVSLVRPAVRPVAVP